MKAYPKYKDSGVQWLGQIPEHWETKRVAILFAENKRKNTNNEFDRAMKFNYGNLVHKNEIGNVADLKETYSAYTIIEKNDIAINCLNLNYDFVSQRVAIARNRGILTSAYLIMTPRAGVNADFYNLYFKAMDNQKLFHGMGTGIRLTLSYSDLKGQQVAAPIDEEQNIIVTFLDSKTSKIDTYIAEKEKEIEALKELKQVEIANAVTHGLNPNVPMKDSGIAWIGKVPEHWEVKRLAISFSENKTKNSNYEFDHAMKFNYGNLVPKNEQGDVSDLKETYLSYTILEKNDIAINCLNLNYDFVSQRVAIAKQRGILTSAYLIITPRGGVNAEYYNLLFKAMDSKKLFHGMGTGIRLTLSYSELKKQMIPIPPFDEQANIVTYLNEKLEKIDTMVSNIQTQISHLKEYKQRLISDVVTGKVDVRDWAQNK